MLGAVRGGGAAPAPPARSAVSATMTDFTPGTARIAASARSRTLSQSFTAPASTVIEKKTLPSLATISESFPVAGSGAPSGLETLPSAARTSSFMSAIRWSSKNAREATIYIGARPWRSIGGPAPRLTRRRQPGHDHAGNCRTLGGNNGKGRIRRARRHGLPDGGTSQGQGRPRGHGLQPHRRQGRKMGCPARRQKRADAETGRRGPGFRHGLRRQRQRFARGDAGQGRRLRRRRQGRRRGRPHHRFRRDRARASRRSEKARLRFHRCAGLGRPGRRRERRADGDVRRRRRRRSRQPKK